MKKQAGPPQLPTPSIMRGLPAFSRRRAAALNSLFPLHGVRIPPGRAFRIIGNSEEFPTIRKKGSQAAPFYMSSPALPLSENLAQEGFQSFILWI